MIRLAVSGLFLFAACELALNAPVARAQQDDTFRIYDIEHTTGLNLARGFDILTGAPRAECVVPKKPEENPGYGPDSVGFRSYRIENSQQLDRALGISASASIKMGVGSASGSVSYSNALSVSSYGLNYVVESSIKQKGKSVLAETLKEPYRKLLASGKPELLGRFRSICGDGYITEMPTGGEFKAIIQIATNSRSETEAMAASIGGSYAAYSGAASFSNSVKKAASTNEVRIWSFRRGGGGPVPITPDDIATEAANLPVSAAKTPAPLQIAVFSYTTVLDDPSIPLDTFSERAAQIEKLADLSSRARNQLGDLQFIMNHPSQFYSRPTDLPQLAQEAESLNEFRALIKHRADECIKSDGACYIGDLTPPQPSVRPARR
ncbi:hypothetical protein [Bradyrhizobium sp.]|uniref:hypothetical protein n=1 Tax=Bradyrhizobium sp. TaxID=376 RepID=UPI0025BC0591|nr:hypothetical protein [Bradyrhizobium sp.]